MMKQIYFAERSEGVISWLYVSTLFDGLDISRSDTYKAHLNQYNVSNLSLNRLPDQGSTYEDYIGLVRNAIKRDVREAYPALGKFMRDLLREEGIS